MKNKEMIGASERLVLFSIFLHFVMHTSYALTFPVHMYEGATT